MNDADSTPVTTSVKLFPRLATPHFPRRARRGRLVAGGQIANPVGVVVSRDELRGQLRTRLLHMILDNERVRRNEQRPSAS